MDGNKMSKATIDLSEYRKTGDYNHFINLMTRGVSADLSRDQRLAVLREFMTTKKGDHHYTIMVEDTDYDRPGERRFQKLYACENGNGYTLMLPEEY